MDKKKSHREGQVPGGVTAKQSQRQEKYSTIRNILQEGRKMKEEPRANYWAVIPGGVLYDPELPGNAKLLYGLISALTNQEGYCFAGNDYFACRMGVEERTVRRWLSALQKRGFIRILEERGSRNVLTRRRIYAGINPLYAEESSLDKNVQTDSVRTKMSASLDKNVQTNIIENKSLDIPPQAPQGARRVKPKAIKSVPEWKPDRFAGFWDFYPASAHKSKQAAIRSWDRLRPSDELIAEIGKALRRQKASDEWKRGVGIPYPATYLNQRRWEDEIPDGPEDDPDEEPVEDLPEWT